MRQPTGSCGPPVQLRCFVFSAPRLSQSDQLRFPAPRQTFLKWIAVVVGFLGTLFIVRPGSDMLSWASLLALGTALCYSLYQIMTRMFSEDEDPLVTLFYTAIVGCVALSLVVSFLRITPSSAHLGLFLFIEYSGIGWILSSHQGIGDRTRPRCRRSDTVNGSG